MHPSRWAEGLVVESPGRPSAGMVRFIRKVLAPTMRILHRPTLTGIDHLPKDRPFLLVANHSAGIGFSEALSFMALYERDVGADRPLAGFAHPFAFHIFPASIVLREVGAIPSTYEAAAAALAAGVPVLVFPGGEHETLRPIWQANQVDFGGRMGFLRIARTANVPIVPLGIRGSHMTAPMLFRARVLSKIFIFPLLVGLNRWAISLLGVIVSLGILIVPPASLFVRILFVWLFLGSPFAFLPWIPWTIRMRIGAPIEPSDLFAKDDLTVALKRVEQTVSRLVNE